MEPWPESDLALWRLDVRTVDFWEWQDMADSEAYLVSSFVIYLIFKLYCEKLRLWRFEEDGLTTSDDLFVTSVLSTSI